MVPMQSESQDFLLKRRQLLSAALLAAPTLRRTEFTLMDSFGAMSNAAAFFSDGTGWRGSRADDRDARPLS